jgi:hypothetical protein
MGNSGYLPDRFKENWHKDESKGYAIYRSYPATAIRLRGWIEDAYARLAQTHAKFISNTLAT